MCLHFNGTHPQHHICEDVRFLQIPKTETATIVQVGSESAPPMTELGESTYETDLVGIVTEEL